MKELMMLRIELTTPHYNTSNNRETTRLSVTNPEPVLHSDVSFRVVGGCSQSLDALLLFLIFREKSESINRLELPSIHPRNQGGKCQDIFFSLK